MLHQHFLELVLSAVVTHLDCSFPIYRFTDLLQCEASQLLEILGIAIDRYYYLFRMIMVMVPKYIKTHEILHIEKQHLD